MILLLAIIATWRITFMLTEEVGPYMLIHKLRRKLANKEWIDMYCFYCMSIWVATPIALIYTKDLWEFIISIFALSGGAIAINVIKERLE